MSSDKRELCPECDRPPTRCLCPYILATANRIPLVILQHPSEQKHPKNTAGLLCRSLQHCRIITGEVFSHECLAGILPDAALLYPAGSTEQIGAAPPPSRLIVLDATWRKSRKMLYLNQALAALPRVSLVPAIPSRYQVRSASQAHQLSTLEASCYALQQLENEPKRYLPLLGAFDQYMTHLASFDPYRRAATESRDV